VPYEQVAALVGQATHCPAVVLKAYPGQDPAHGHPGPIVVQGIQIPPARMELFAAAAAVLGVNPTLQATQSELAPVVAPVEVGL